MKQTMRFLGLVAAVVLLAACSKERQCKCTTTDGSDDGLLKILAVDHSMKCESIKEMAIELHTIDTASLSHSLVRTEAHPVSCRPYGE